MSLISNISQGFHIDEAFTLLQTGKNRDVLKEEDQEVQTHISNAVKVILKEGNDNKIADLVRTCLAFPEIYRAVIPTINQIYNSTMYYISLVEEEKIDFTNDSATKFMTAVYTSYPSFQATDLLRNMQNSILEMVDELDHPKDQIDLFVKLLPRAASEEIIQHIQISVRWLNENGITDIRDIQISKGDSLFSGHTLKIEGNSFYFLDHSGKLSWVTLSSKAQTYRNLSSFLCRGPVLYISKKQFKQLSSKKITKNTLVAICGSSIEILPMPKIRTPLSLRELVVKKLLLEADNFEEFYKQDARILEAAFSAVDLLRQKDLDETEEDKLLLKEIDHFEKVTNKPFHDAFTELGKIEITN